MPDLPRKLKVFLCHASENKPIVRELYERLKVDGFEPWLDSEFLFPGMNWDLEIQKAMHESDAVIVCFSTVSVTKEGYVQKEIIFAQDIQNEKPEGTIFLIPLQLEICEMPFSLRFVQWGHYFEPDGYEKVVKSLTARAKQLGRVIEKPGITPVIGLPPGSYIPFTRNALFTGREKDLELLAKVLTYPPQPPLPSREGGSGGLGPVVITQAITGMGGLGKTQLAVEFAYRYGQHFKGVHWLDLRDPSALESQIALCGSKMALQPWPDKQPEQVALTLHEWQTNGPRLLILDNFEEVTKANEVLACFQHPSLRLLVTSRRSDFPKSTGLQIQKLDTFTKQESLDFIAKTLPSPSKGGARGDALSLLKGDVQLAETLGCLPLALELAANYININKISIADYLKELEDLLAHESMQADWFKELDISSPTAHDQSLLATFQLSWAQVKDENQQKVFKVAGYCAPNTPIPLEILRETLGLDNKALNKALYRLNTLGLLKADDDQPTIHPLLAALACWLDGEISVLNKLIETLVYIANERNVMVDKTGDYSLYFPLLPHVRAVAGKAELAQAEAAGRLWNSLGYHIHDLADYQGAKATFERALRILEKQLGPNHPYVATAVSNLGRVHHALDSLQDAKAAFERALNINEAAFGANHPNVATDVNNLGMVLYDLGDLRGAKASFERALRIDEATFNPNHPKVAAVVNNLGLVFRALGNLQEAKTSFERALRIDEAAFGVNHPKVARDVNNLGEALRALGDLQKAQATFERALRIDEAAFGVNHPNVATDMNNLGLVFRAQGDLQEAKAAFERALHIDEAVFGFNHHEAATDVNNLGLVLRALGDLQGAKAAFERALRIDETAFGTNHPKVARDVNNLGGVLRALGDLKGAKAAFERALQIDEAAFGPAYSKIATDMNNLGGVLQDLGDLQEAKAAFERALQIDEATFGSEHYKVAIDTNSLGRVFRDLGNLHEAKAAFERALHIDEVAFGPDHPNVARDINNLGRALQDLGNLQGAKAAFERALRIDEATFGPNHSYVARDINSLGRVLRALGDLQEAKAAFERALRIDEATFGPNHSYVARDTNNLGGVLRALGDLQGAKAAFECSLRINKQFLPPNHPAIKATAKNLDFVEKQIKKKESK